MSHCASFLCLNGLFESSFFYAEHLTASEKYKFSRQWCVIREVCFAETTKTRKCLVRQGTGATGNSLPASNKALELTEILSPRSTRHWNDWKFVASKRWETGTDGNFFPASDGTLELSEICSQHAMEHWNWWKTSASFTK